MPDEANEQWEPLGQAMLDYYRGQMHTTIVVKSSVEQDREVPLGVFFREGPLSKLEKTALRCCRGQTLDAGAGTGSHALMLQRKGLDVTGMDISASACTLMRERGLNKVICGSLFDLEGVQYDTILMLMNGIGLAQDIASLDKLLAHLYGLLKPGGQIICDSTDIAYVSVHSKSLATVKPPDPDQYYGVVWYQLRYKGREGEPYPWLFVDKDTLARFARKNGFCMEIMAKQQEQYLASLTRLESET